jgi:hypothetical protein
MVESLNAGNKWAEAILKIINTTAWKNNYFFHYCPLNYKKY